MTNKTKGWLLITPMVLFFLISIGMLYSWTLTFAIITAVILFVLFMKGIEYLVK